MYQSTAHKELNQLIKASTDDDMIWFLHLMNKDNEEHRCNINISDTDDLLIQSTINILNTLKNTDEIRRKILDNYTNINENSIFNFMDSLKIFRDNLNIRGKDISDYKTNKRLLYFTFHSMSSDREISWRTMLTIQNDYFRFLYMLFISPSFSRSNRFLNNIEERFSTILAKNELHFKSFDSNDFYLWAKNYMDQDSENARFYNSRDYTPVIPQDYKIVVNAIFDVLLDTNPHIYKALRDKLSNAWYQKSYRKKHKGRKHYYFFTDVTFECLQILAKKYNLTEEKVIDRLINEHYVKECRSNDTGNHYYTL
ncbi:MULTISPECIES: hypothetical protein [unclassified Acinetobacter]|uniref:hypothetical protein n=1 Tax=unclassified Acinetobacter TaxID=196816 RepID=UPI000B3C7D9F|nr:MULTISPECIES: hypothetical protein [unclassified Acinetobacter]AVZ85150.1 hypothetical protein CDG55_04875 [Acinetobacter sp. WCHA45]MCL5768187.1 hypothetical protein [Acinetobacter sp. ANC5681]